jgi:TldD protein
MKNETNLNQSADSMAFASQTLLRANDLDFPQVQGVLKQIMTHEVDYADLYFQYTRSESWGLEEGRVKSGHFHIEQGVGVRAVSGEKTAFAYSDDIRADALLNAANITRAIAQAGQERSVPALIKRQPPSLYLPQDPIASLSAEAKVKLLEKLESYARAMDPRVKQVMASIAGEYEVVLIARHDGVMAADIRPLVRLSINVIAESNGRREQGSSGGGGRFDYSGFSDEVLQQ